MIAIYNASIVLENSIIEDGTLLVDGGKILSYGKGSDIKIPDSAEKVDAEGQYVGPGFIDIHVHGGNGYFLYKDPIEATRHFLSHGETTVLPTFYPNMTKDEYIESINRVREAMKDPEVGDAIGGFYMEGPYMNPEYGADKKNNKWKGVIKAEDYEDVVRLAGKDAKVWVVAPERKGIESFAKFAKEINPDVMISVGHSNATVDEIAALKKYGLYLHTHLTDATGRRRRTPGTKTCGPDEACYLDPDAYAEIICDSQAIHVERHMLRFIIMLKGFDKLLLISDSYVADFDPPENLKHITDLSFDNESHLCGSRLTLDIACKNAMMHMGCSITEAFKMASVNPAKVIKEYDNRGSIAEGKRADLVIVDGDFNVKRVMLNGRFVK